MPATIVMRLQERAMPATIAAAMMVQGKNLRGHGPLLQIVRDNVDTVIDRRRYT